MLVTPAASHLSRQAQACLIFSVGQNKMSDRSDILFQKHRDAGEKLDYLICGISGAIFAYITEGYKPHKIVFGPDALEPLSVILLGLAFFCGMKRIEHYIDALKSNYDHVEHSVNHGKTVTAIDDGIFPVKSSTGEIYTLQDLVAREKHFSQKKKEALGSTVRLAKISFSYYGKAQIFLFSGILAISLHRILLPYA